MNKNALISLRGIRVDFDDEPVLKGIDLDIMDKEFITFLGPSGCGKTTTLRIIGGFIQPKEGDVFFGGVRINDLPPYKREVNTVFQRYALFPHLNVYENVEFGLKIAKVPEKERRQSVKEMLKLVGLSGYDRRHISQLSGGQQQRVAIARALVTNPEIICLDEPLSNLDAKLRVQLRNELKDLQKRFGITTVYVTHDQEEALTLSDRIAVFNKGVIEQIGHPDEIYSHSATEFVCNFIGDINRLTPEFLAGTGADKVEGVDPKKHCYIRLERMHVNETMATDTLKTEAVVEDYEFYGLYIKYTVRAFGQTIKVIEKNSGKTLYKKGDTVTLSYNPADIMQYEG